MPNQRSQLEATFLSRLQSKAPPLAAAAEQGELAGRRRDPSLFSLSLARILPDADQVRRSNKAATDSSVQELAESIRSAGVLQPLDVRYVREGDYYEIVAGERRYTAAKLLGLEEVPVKLLQASDAEVHRLQILENIHRLDLSPLELGTALLQLSEDGAAPGDLAQLLCKTKSYIAKALGIARNLSPEARRIIQEAPDGFQSMTHLYEVSLLPAAEQPSVLARIADGNLNRDQLQQVTAEIKQAATARPGRAGRPPKPRTFTKTIDLPDATVTVRLSKADATPDDVAAVLRQALDTLA